MPTRSARRSGPSPVARPQRVFIDTNELFPFTIMDILLTMAEDFLFTWVWTDELLAEWEEVIVREGSRTPASAASVVSVVRTYFGRYRLDPDRYRDRITPDLSPDAADRVHAAAVIHGDVDVLLTRNLKHLRTEPVVEAGVAVMTSDEFLCGLLARRRRSVIESFRHAAANKTDPPVTPLQLAERLAVAGAPHFAKRLRPSL